VDKFPASPFPRGFVGASSLLTYEPYYGLKEKPFSLSTDPRFLYRSAEHSRTFDDLLLAIRRREGLIVLTGDIGTGKTTLCRAVLEKLDRKTFSTFVPDPFITREDLLKRLLIDFGVMSVDDLTSGRMTGSSPSDLSYPLYEFLKSLVPLQAFAVLVIDETQNLALPLLEEIRILSDLEAPEKLLQVVLVGQLELRAKLKLPEMRQLDQRVTARCNLHALTRDGVSGYILHRLHVAGGTEDRIHFVPAALDAIFRASGGVPRVINLICDRALYLSYLHQRSEIDVDVVTRSIDDLGVGHLTAAPSPAELPVAREAVRETEPAPIIAPISIATPVDAGEPRSTEPRVQNAEPLPQTAKPLLHLDDMFQIERPLRTDEPPSPPAPSVEALQLIQAVQARETLHPIKPGEPIKVDLPIETDEPIDALLPVKTDRQTQIAPPLTDEPTRTPEQPPEIDLPAARAERPPTVDLAKSELPPPMAPQTTPMELSKLDDLLKRKAPAAATATAQPALDSDLSGLDVDDIPNDLTAPIAEHVPPEPEESQNPILALRAKANRDMLDESTSALRWKRRALRVAGAVGIAVMLFSFVVLGEIVVMTYYPDPATLELPFPDAPRPPRMAALPLPVEAPEDLPAEVLANPRAALPRAPVKAE